MTRHAAWVTSGLALASALSCRPQPTVAPVEASQTSAHRLALSRDSVCAMGQRDQANQASAPLRCWGTSPLATNPNADLVALLGDCTLTATQIHCPPAIGWSALDLPMSAREHGIRAMGTRCIADHRGAHSCTGRGDPRWTTPTPVAQVIDISGADVSGCVLAADGALTCWEPDRPHKNPLASTNASLIALARESDMRAGCGLDDRGDAWCWRTRSDESHGAREPLSAIGAVVGLSSSRAHACANFDDGRVRCWGLPGLTCKRPMVLGSLESTVPDLPPVVEVRAGIDATCALTNTDEVWCWGDAAAWGTPDPSVRAEPREVDGITAARALAVAESQTCALLDSGQVQCWGRWFGGLVSPKPHCRDFRPRLVDGVEQAIALALGPNLGCAVERDGRLACWGPDGTQTWESRAASMIAGPNADATSAADAELAMVWDQVCTIRAGTVHCWAILDPFQANHAVDPLVWTPLDGHEKERLITLAPREDRICGWTEQQRVHCWTHDGSKTVPQPQPDSSNASSGQTAPPLPSATVSLGFGDYHGCALGQDGRVRCWGDGSDGQLGNAILPKWSAPVRLGAVDGD